MYDAQGMEKEILNFWHTQKIFDKLRKKNKGKKTFSFLDGPITANNPMGVHHAWGRTYKDIFQRFKAMQGFDQRYQNGFDCQGLWIEREEEKDLGLKTKEDIEKFGILKFVQSCKKRVEKFSKIQTSQSIRLGQWMDWNNSYYTMTDVNNLHNWHLLKVYFEKGWLYKGKDSVPWCWRCGTASSKHDIVTEGYKEITHDALFMKFPIKGKENEFFLIFTTTPWTVPVNVAIAVNEGINYIKAKQGNNYYWIAESREKELQEPYTIIQKLKGRELKGVEYEMPYSDLPPQRDVKHKVVLWEMASEEEGTGIVHIAPGCGAEDYNLGKRLNLPKLSPLDDQGVYGQNFGKFSNKKYSKVTQEVLEDSRERNFAYKIERYRHRYPHCWRCGSELVFRLVDEWYIKCEEIRNNLIKENKKIYWFPEYGRTRQEDWFKNMGDWLISRKRYWGLPLPIWECSCGEIDVIGSLKELKQKAIIKEKVDMLPEIHRPWIDEIKTKCKKCGKEVSRIPDVGDAWLDAGITPFSTIGPYLENKKEWKKWFPADFICENMPGQYRGWFNALFWSSVTLTGKTPFKSILGYETLKDEGGEEMHKSKGNAIWFDDAVEKMGADPMRFLYALQDPSQELRFGFNVVREIKNNINILYNMSKLIEKSSSKKSYQIEDKWILSKFNSLVGEVTKELEKLHPHVAVRALKGFWLNELSRGYIQFIRDRIAEEDKTARYVLSQVYIGLLKLIAPTMPFISERIYLDLKEKLNLKEESIHLESWPKVNEKEIDKKLETAMNLAKDITSRILSEREAKQIGVRWPLSKATISLPKEQHKSIETLAELIKTQSNIKELEIKTAKELEVKLDTHITKELETEGFYREISRKIQALRKQVGLIKTDEISLVIDAAHDIQEFEDELKGRVGAVNLMFGAISGKFDVMSEEKVKGKVFRIAFNKL